MNKIFISKAEVKHINSKAIVTIYVYNRERLILLKKIWKIKKILKTLMITREWLRSKIFQSKVLFNKIHQFNIIDNEKTLIDNQLISESTLNLFLKNRLQKELLLLKKYRLKLQVNKFKFESKFLYKLTKLISKIYNKNIEFNIVNLKSIILNSDLFTKILSLKLKKDKSNVLRMMNIVLNKAVLPKVNRIKEKSKLVKNINFKLVENKYKNLSLNNIIQENFEKIFNELYSNLLISEDYNELNENLFNVIDYKNLGGIRIEAKGRLTRRYRADKAIFKVKWKGGLKNIDSSYKGISTVNMRGYEKSSMEYSLFASKRRIGAFAIKGWISGK